MTWPLRSTTSSRALTPAAARGLAKKIAETNKRIGGAVLARFIDKIGPKE